MNRQEVITILRQNADALRARGVRHAALFGSIARGSAGPFSDIDILIDLEPNIPLDIYAYTGIKRYIASLFPQRVDVVSRDALKPHLRRPAEADVLYAF